MNELQPLAVKPKQGGYTIIELGIALTIIAVLIVAGLTGVNSLLLSSKANTQIEESGRALAKLQAILTSTSVSGVTTASANGMGLFPTSRITGTGATTKVTTVMGGGEEFVRSNSGSDLSTSANGIALAVNTGAVYTLTNIPKAVCADLASSLASISAAAYVYTATVAEDASGANSNLTVANNIKAAGGNVLGAAIGTQCNAANTVSMSFVLRP